MPPQSLQLLEQLVAGYHMTPSDLDNLINRRVEEGIFLDYKHGNELQRNEATRTIREYMSAFANSAGGILIVGINAPNKIPTEITGCLGHSKGNLDDWAATCLSPIANYFSPQPRFHVVDHPNGQVLVGAVQRSQSLVPIVEAGSIVYYFRLHDQTLKAPDYLIGDILLGRRQQPILEITNYEAYDVQPVLHNPPVNATDLRFHLRFSFENMSIVWAEDSRWGVVAWVQSTNSQRYTLSVDEPSRHLLSYVDVQEKNIDGYTRERELTHISGTAVINKPFEKDMRSIVVDVPLRILRMWFSYNWEAALYIITKNSPPRWYQIRFPISISVLNYIQSNNRIAKSDNMISIEPLTTQRPVVGWSNFTAEESA